MGDNDVERCLLYVLVDVERERNELDTRTLSLSVGLQCYVIMLSDQAYMG